MIIFTVLPKKVVIPVFQVGKSIFHQISKRFVNRDVYRKVSGRVRKVGVSESENLEDFREGSQSVTTCLKLVSALTNFFALFVHFRGLSHLRILDRGLKYRENRRFLPELISNQFLFLEVRKLCNFRA